MKHNDYQQPDFSSEQFVKAPDVTMKEVVSDFCPPEGYHALSIFPEYFKISGKWQLIEESRMDCAAVYENGRILAKEFRHLHKGDLVIIGRREDGSEGIYVQADAFTQRNDENENFAFRRIRSRETSFSRDYAELAELLKEEKDNGFIVWVLGPAVTFDAETRDHFARLIENGYVHALLAGNALAVHDLEGAIFRTALGQDICRQENVPDGHYHHLDVIAKARSYGSVEKLVSEERISDGIISACIRNDVPFELAGSIRDDGPLPGVIGDVYAAQDAMRAQLSKATTVICLASTLHAIASGNMTPSYRVMPDKKIRPLYFYAVDVSEFAINKLLNRGSLTSRGIVSNVQDFLAKLSQGLSLSASR